MGALIQRAATPLAAKSAAPVDASLPYLTFLLAGELYAIGIQNVKEIIEYGQPTEVPLMPDAIRGVINLRGAVVPVVDLAARFGRPRAPISRRSCIVIVEVEADADGRRHDFGVVVDAVSEVLEIAGADIEPAPRFGTRLRAEFIAGMARVAGGFAIVLSVGEVLALDDLDQPANPSSAAVGPSAAELLPQS